MSGFSSVCTLSVCYLFWQALCQKKLAALFGAVDSTNPVLLSVAAFIAKNVVNGNRAAQEWLLEWKEVTVAERHGKTIGLTTAVGLTKVDRLQRGETKPLQCTSGCTGRLELTEDGAIDVGALCPVHLLLYLGGIFRAAWDPV